MDECIFKSIGIDIGTSTTKIIFSQLCVENRAPTGFTTDLKICEKKILYKSPIYFTPLLYDGNIDFSQLKNILDHEFQESGMIRNEIRTGAVIITGESARKHNSAEITQQLADYAGNFVVAIAGPDIEAILAGYGSGAAELARITGNRVMNINIGGGTTNIAIFQGNEIIDAFALDLGGRLIRYNNQDQIEYVSSRLNPIFDREQVTIQEGELFDITKLHQLTNHMADYLIKLCTIDSFDDIPSQLFLEHLPNSPFSLKKDDILCFSGGVAEFINTFLQKHPDLSQENRSSIHPIKYYKQYNDIGIIFAESIAYAFAPILIIPAKSLESHNSSITMISGKSGFKIIESAEKIRATVIGAGNNSVTLSGSTIFIDNIQLPLKNIPVIPILSKIALQSEDAFKTFKKELYTKFQRYQEPIVAFWLDGPVSPTYTFVKNLAESFLEVLEPILRDEIPIIILLEHDFAKALGQSIKIRLKTPHALLVIDRINVTFGDYIDIGQTIMGVVPVILKTFIFNSNHIKKNHELKSTEENSFCA